jgi:hypothetical protein
MQWLVVRWDLLGDGWTSRRPQKKQCTGADGAGECQERDEGEAHDYENKDAQGPGDDHVRLDGCSDHGIFRNSSSQFKTMRMSRRQEARLTDETLPGIIGPSRGEAMTDATESNVTGRRLEFALRAIEPADADECARIAYEAFARLHDYHQFPRDFPTLEAAAQLTSSFIAHPKI